MLLKDIILESAIKWVYHIRSLDSGINILRKNYMQLSSTRDYNEKIPSKELPGYYISLARSTTSYYLIRYAEKHPDGFILFVMDNQKLSQRYKSFPTNYFYDVDKNRFKDNMEERLVSDKPILQNVSKYIKEIHVYADPADDDAMSKAFEITGLAKSRGMRVYYYPDPKAALTMRKAKSIDINTKVNPEDDLKYDYEKMTPKEELVIRYINGDCSASEEYAKISKSGWSIEDRAKSYFGGGYEPTEEKQNRYFEEQVIDNILRWKPTPMFVREIKRLMRKSKRDWVNFIPCLRKYYEKQYRQYLKDKERLGIEESYTTNKKIINEAAYKKLYHIRSLESAIKMVETNAAKLSPIDTSEYVPSMDRFGYYLSLSRTPMNVFFHDLFVQNEYVGVVVFEIDGGKLGQRYDLFPTDYFASRHYARKGKEAEERLYSRRGKLPNWNMYVEAIHVYYKDFGGETSKDVLAKFLRLIEAAGKYNIPVYHYKDKTTFKTLNRRKAVRITPDYIEEIRYSNEPAPKKDMTDAEYALSKILKGERIARDDIMALDGTISGIGILKDWTNKDLKSFIAKLQEVIADANHPVIYRLARPYDLGYTDRRGKKRLEDLPNIRSHFEK